VGVGPVKCLVTSVKSFTAFANAFSGLVKRFAGAENQVADPVNAFAPDVIVFTGLERDCSEPVKCFARPAKHFAEAAMAVAAFANDLPELTRESTNLFPSVSGPGRHPSSPSGS